MQSNWEIALGVCAILAVSVAVATLVYAIRSGRKQAEQLSAQTMNISDQTDLLRKQVFGEVYEEARIRNVQFFLPEKRKREVVGFVGQQKEDEEVVFGKELQVKKGVSVELHVQFWSDAPQNVRFLTWGFLDRWEGKNYPGKPTIDKYITPFGEEVVSTLPRGIYRDWHGHWHVDYGFVRFLPKDECLVVCFTLSGSRVGKFPFLFEVCTQEAKRTYTEILRVEVIT